ncbi:MAG: HlyD family type I secretion periplasmic adaptor subunit [Alphaproteobacteria bacterium]|nr:HlyD family type I secretion periplasmic adaptor subunit [Alphaproteobacteria bacterium]
MSLQDFAIRLGLHQDGQDDFNFKSVFTNAVQRVQELFTRADQQESDAGGLTDTRRPLVVGGIIILVTFFGFGLWAAIAPIDSAAIAPGFLTVQSSRRTIQHLEGGIVQEIFVKDGMTVDAGDVLIRLDETRAKAQNDILHADLDSQLAAEARLLAERDGLSTPVFPKEVLERESNPTIAALMAGQRNVFDTRSSSLSGQKSILQQRVGQFEQQIEGLRALVTAKGTQARLIKEELKDLSGLLERGYVTKTRVLALQREAARLEGERAEHMSAIARSQQGIGEAKLQIFQLEKSRQEEIARELRDVQAKITELRERMVAASDMLRRIDIVAPVSGTVMDLAVHTSGGVIGPGLPLMDIVPLNDVLVVEAHINPIDIDTIRPGSEVALRISTVDSRKTPVINGVLETISADRTVDQRTGAAYYKGRVIIPPDQRELLGGLTLRSGMQVEALINRGEQTALQYALKPLTEAFAKSFREK